MGHDPEGQHPLRSTRAQHVDVVDVAGAGHHRVHQGHHLAAGACPANSPDQAHLGVHEALKLDTNGHGRDQQQPCVGHQVRLVEAHPYAVDGVRYSPH